jgi:hypothetical protein
MPVQSGQITVGTVRAQIPVTCIMPFRLEIKNMDNTDDIFIGNGDVSTTNGIALAKFERITLQLAPGDAVFVVSSKGTHKVGWIKFGQSCL